MIFRDAEARAVGKQGTASGSRRKRAEHDEISESRATSRSQPSGRLVEKASAWRGREWYDSTYGSFADDLDAAIRSEALGEEIGQNWWLKRR